MNAPILLPEDKQRANFRSIFQTRNSGCHQLSKKTIWIIKRKFKEIMLIQKTCFFKLFMPSAVLGLLIGIAPLGKTQDKKASAQKSDLAPPLVLVVPDFKGASDDEVVRLRDDVEEQQEFIRRTLLNQLEDTQLSPLARSETLSLLGNISPNHPETIVALIQNIDVIAPHPHLHGEANMNRDRFIGFIARHVLIRIGSPAEREILDIIGSQSPIDKGLEENSGLGSYYFSSSKVQGFADVLTQIEGKQGALSKLQNEQTKAKTPTIKAQFQAVIEVVKKGATPVPRNKY